MRALIAWLLLSFACQSMAAAPIPVSIALPGPGSLPYLPVELMTRIGADADEGLKVSLRYFTGGPLALKDMLAGNSSFVALGFSALAQTADIQGKAYSVVSLTHVPAFTLMVSNTLKGKVKTVADLRGRSIGIPTSSKSGKSVGQQLTEFLLIKADVSLSDVNLVSSGMNQEHHAVALKSGMVDALIINEPSATKLEATNAAYRLADLHDPATTRRHFGSLIQYTQVATRQDVIREQADKVNRVVAALLRTLKWIQQHSPREIADRMGIADKKQHAILVSVLEKHKGMFSPDGVFSAETLKGTAALIQAISDEPGRTSDLDALVDDQWVGRRQ